MQQLIDTALSSAGIPVPVLLVFSLRLGMTAVRSSRCEAVWFAQ
jgi:hypothetical protein